MKISFSGTNYSKQLKNGGTGGTANKGLTNAHPKSLLRVCILFTLHLKFNLPMQICVKSSANRETEQTLTITFPNGYMYSRECHGKHQSQHQHQHQYFFLLLLFRYLNLHMPYLHILVFSQNKQLTSIRIASRVNNFHELNYL